MTANDGGNGLRAIVLEAIAEISKVAPAATGPDQSLAQDLGIDSLDFVRLVQILEERLDITVNDELAAAATTVDDLVSLCGAAVAASR